MYLLDDFAVQRNRFSYNYQEPEDEIHTRSNDANFFFQICNKKSQNLKRKKKKSFQAM